MRAGVLTQPEAEQLIAAATTAPSTHNLQPWRFAARLRDAVIEIYADPARAIGSADPQGRAVHIACGAALFNLRLAVAHAGAEPIARLLPTAADPLLLASVRVGGPHRPGPDERDLHAAIRWAAGGTRHHVTGRAPLARLAEAAALEGASLHLLGPAEATHILERTAAADRSLRADPAYLSQLARFTPERPGQRAASRPGCRLAVVATRADDRASWLRAGQALQRVLLLAAHHGFPVFPLSPVLELPESRLRPDPRYGAGYPEMIVCLGPAPGWPGRPPGQRRPVRQVMRVAATPGPWDEGPRLLPPPALAPTGR